MLLRDAEAHVHHGFTPRPSAVARSGMANDADGAEAIGPVRPLPVDPFAETAPEFTEAEARAEAERCLMCGACGNCRACVDALACPALLVAGDRVAVDAALCGGCGVCAQICSSSALGRPAAAP